LTLSKTVTRTCISKTCSLVFASKRFPVLLNLVKNVFILNQTSILSITKKQIGKLKSKVGVNYKQKSKAKYIGKDRSKIYQGLCIAKYIGFSLIM